MNNSKSILLARNLLDSLNMHFKSFRYGDDELLFLSPLAQTNIFVGATNSGKTRFMRLLLNELGTIIIDHNGKIEQLVATAQGCLIALEQNEENAKKRETEQGDQGIQTSSMRIDFRGIQSNEYKFLEPIINEIISRNALTAKNIQKPIDFNSFYFQSLKETLKNYLCGQFQKVEFQDFYHEKLFEILVAVQLGETFYPLDRYFTDHSPEERESLKITANALCKLREELQSVTIHRRKLADQKTVYIPTLRSAHTLTDSNGGRIPDTFFRTNIADHYQLVSSVEIFTGLELYQQLDRDFRGRRRKDLESFEEFLSKTFFNSIGVEIIPEHPDETYARPPEKGKMRHGVIAVKLGQSGMEMPIHLLGDGIQSLIILLYRVFMASSDTWFFIDEPEIGLHPGLQRIFLDAITNHPDIIKKNHRFFLTTHSNHLLDLTIDKKNISIFTFSSRGEGDDQKHIIRSSSNDRLSALTELGVLNSSVLMANCSIWVEGVTDRLYIQKYLNEYCIKEKLPIHQEDIHYAFFEYAGSNLAHYVWATDDDADDTDIGDDGTETEGTDNADKDDIAEKIHMQFIANHVFLIADRDKGKTKKHEFWSQKVMQSKGAFNYYVTPGKEVENLLSPEVLKAIFSSGAFRPTLKDKKENPKSEIQESDFKHTEYCDPNNPDNPVNEIGLAGYLVDKWKLTEGYLQDGKSQTGTFNPTAKLKVATEAVKRIIADNMGKPAHDLARQVYEFIGRHNPMVGGSHGKT